MKTLTSTIRGTRELETRIGRQWLGSVAMYLREILGLAVALIVAAALVTLSVWLAGRPAGPVLAACSWGIGFIFLGLAVDGRGWSAIIRAMTGVALPVLAVLASRVSADFMIVSGVLLAAWAGHSVLKRTSDQTV